MGRPRPPARIDADAALTNAAARHQVGGFVNAINEIGKRAGGADRLPSSARIAAAALWGLLHDLDVVRGSAERAGEVWCDADD